MEQINLFGNVAGEWKRFTTEVSSILWGWAERKQTEEISFTCISLGSSIRFMIILVRKKMWSSYIWKSVHLSVH